MLEESMISQFFTVIGGDDHDGFVEQIAALQVVEQLTQPPVEVCQAVLVGVFDQVDEVLAQPDLIDLLPALDQHHEIGHTARTGAEAEPRPFRRQVRCMRIIVIEKTQRTAAASLAGAITSE